MQIIQTTNFLPQENISLAWLNNHHNINVSWRTSLNVPLCRMKNKVKDYSMCLTWKVRGWNRNVK